MPRTVVQKGRRDELPAVSRAQTVIAQRQIFADKPRLIGIKEKLSDENAKVRADQSKQNDPRSLRPTPRRPRRFSTGEAHVSEVIATKIRCRWILVDRALRRRVFRNLKVRAD
jgi:hypothetical protein